MKKFIFSMLVISSAVFGDNISEAKKYFNSGVSYVKSENYSEAINDFTKSIELYPNYTDAYFGRAIPYMNLKKYDLAIKDFNKAIELNPNYTDAYFGRGYSYNKIKNYELSIKDYKKAIEFNPTITDAYMNIFERQMIIGKKFDKSLEENFVKLFTDDKQAVMEYEMLKILQSISSNNAYSLNTEEWDAKYKDAKLGCWNWDYLDEWANAKKNNEKKAKLQNAIKVFKEHGEGKK